MAPVRGLEPLTHRLTVDCATIAPHRNGVELVLKALKSSPVLPYCQGDLNLFLIYTTHSKFKLNISEKAHISYKFCMWFRSVFQPSPNPSL